jgi:hypothetical protein
MGDAGGDRGAPDQAGGATHTAAIVPARPRRVNRSYASAAKRMVRHNFFDSISIY